MTYNGPVYDFYTGQTYQYPEPPRRFSREAKVAFIALGLVAATVVAFLIVMLGLSPDKGTTPAPLRGTSPQATLADESVEDDFVRTILAVGVTGDREELIREGYVICDLLEQGDSRSSVAALLRSGSVSNNGINAITPRQAQWVVEKSNIFLCPEVSSI